MPIVLALIFAIPTYGISLIVLLIYVLNGVAHYAENEKKLKYAIVHLSTDSFPLQTLIQKIDYKSTLTYARSFGRIREPIGLGQFIEFTVEIDSIEYLVTATANKNGDGIFLTSTIIEEYQEEIYMEIATENKEDISHNEPKTTFSLVNTVKKNSNTEQGIFSDILNDLNLTLIQLESEKYLENKNRPYEQNLFLMSYAYTRRSVSAGLYLQGIFNKTGHKHSQFFFKSMQLETIQTKEFQILASEQSIELLQSYDNRLSKDLISHITTKVETGYKELFEDNCYDPSGSLFPNIQYKDYEALIEEEELNQILDEYPF